MTFEGYRKWLNERDTIEAQEFNYLDSINIGTIICANPDKTCEDILEIIKDRYGNDYLSKHSDDVRLFGNISQSDFIDYIRWRYGITVTEETIYRFNILNNVQTIEVKPMSYAHWIDKGEYAVCSKCGGRSGTQYDGVEPVSLMTRFCPNCGEKMYATGGVISNERLAEIMKGKENGQR